MVPGGSNVEKGRIEAMVYFEKDHIWRRRVKEALLEKLDRGEELEKRVKELEAKVEELEVKDQPPACTSGKSMMARWGSDDGDGDADELEKQTECLKLIEDSRKAYHAEDERVQHAALNVSM